MKLKQLSLFLENKPGHLERACRVLALAGLNVETMALADTEQFGILRFLIKDWEKARDTLSAAGVAPKVTDVLAVCVPDQPGGLADLLAALANSEINIEYMYGFHAHTVGDSIIVLRPDNPDRAIELLQKANVRILTAADIYA